MAKYRHLLKLFIFLFACTVFIFSVSYVGSLLLDQKKAAENSVSEGSQKAVVHSNTTAVAAQPATETLISEATVKLNEVPNDLQTFLAGNAKIDLPANAEFSLLDLAKKEQLETLSSDTLSVVATGIYQAILPTNFTVDERNISSGLPSYAKLGFEAKVNTAENEDLDFLNPNPTTYVLDLKQSGSSLIVALKGEKLPYDYKIITREVQQIQPQTITQYSPMLSAGQTMVTASGQNGQTAEVYRDSYQGGILVNSEFLANDYYPPDDRVVVQSLAVPANLASASTGTAAAASQPTGSSASSSTSSSTSSNTNTSTNTNSSSNAGTNTSISQATQDVQTAYGS